MVPIRREAATLCLISEFDRIDQAVFVSIKDGFIGVYSQKFVLAHDRKNFQPWMRYNHSWSLEGSADQNFFLQGLS